MALMTFKPTSAGRRSAVRVVTPGLHKGAPHAALVEPFRDHDSVGGRQLVFQSLVVLLAAFLTLLVLMHSGKDAGLSGAAQGPGALQPAAQSASVLAVKYRYFPSASNTG